MTLQSRVVQAAAQWVVECEDISSAEAQWRRGRQLAEAVATQDAARAKAERARICARFDLQVPPPLEPHSACFAPFRLTPSILPHASRIPARLPASYQVRPGMLEGLLS